MRLWYWIRTALRNSFIITMSSLLGVGIMMLMNAEKVEYVLSISFMHLLVFGAAFGMMLTGAVYKLNLSVALGFGSTRKEAFAGLQCYSLVYMLLILSASTAMFLMAGNKNSDFVLEFVIIGFTGLLITGALGSVLGIISIQFGKVAMIVGIVVGMILMGGTLAVFAVLFFDEFITTLPDWFLWLPPAIGVVFRGLCLIPEYKTVYKYNVKQ